MKCVFQVLNKIKPCSLLWLMLLYHQNKSMTFFTIQNMYILRNEHKLRDDSFTDCANIRINNISTRSDYQIFRGKGICVKLHLRCTSYDIYDTVEGGRLDVAELISPQFIEIHPSFVYKVIVSIISNDGLSKNRLRDISTNIFIYLRSIPNIINCFHSDL